MSHDYKKHGKNEKTSIKFNKSCHGEHIMFSMRIFQRQLGYTNVAVAWKKIRKSEKKSGKYPKITIFMKTRSIKAKKRLVENKTFTKIRF